MWKGIIAQKFGDIQEQVYRDNKFDNSHNGTTWARRIVKFFLIQFENIWEDRNRRLHKDHEGTRARTDFSEILIAIDNSEFYVPKIVKACVEKGRFLVAKKKDKAYLEENMAKSNERPPNIR